MKVPASDLGFYEWSGSSPKYHRAQIRRHFGFREYSVADQEKLTEWLAAHVANAERDRDKVRAELFRRCRASVTSIAKRLTYKTASSEERTVSRRVLCNAFKAHGPE